MSSLRAASPLHAARATVQGALCLALALPALILAHPLALAAVAAAAVLVGLAAGEGRRMGRALALAAPFALLIALLNPLITQNGITVIVRLGDLPLLGRTDITLEALVYGAVLGLRALALILCCVLAAVVVDGDELLKLLRRVSFRSALTATLATRMVPVLHRDARRMAEAQRCRATGSPSRVALVSAVASNALDRAVDVAAALEVRGYATGRRPPRVRAAWSRHDRAFAVVAAALAALAISQQVAGVASFEAYPALAGSWGPATWGLAAAIVALPLLPFLDRRGIER